MIGPNIQDTMENRLAVKVINLRRALAVANKFLHRDGKLGILAGEDDGPSFRDGRKFWKEVRELTGENNGN